MDKSISQKIALLNQTTLDSLTERNILKVIENFTCAGLKILEADFGFAWWLTPEKTKYHLIYKSSNTPYEPELPRGRGGNYQAEKTRMPFFVEHARTENYEEGFDVSPYMKSYVIIPITYATHMYGSVVICYKDQHIFSEIDKELASSVGNATAQAITIHNFIERDHNNALASAQLEARLGEEKVRTEFIVNATHEIRTPLAIILGSADLALMKKDLSASATSAFKTIEHEVEHLSALISDLSILTSEEVTFKDKGSFENIDINEVIEVVAKRCAVISRKKKIDIQVSNTPKLIVFGHRVQLERLFLNLVTNSIHYGKDGGWTKIKTVKTDNKAVIQVSDNGIGISQDDLPKIFNRFFRAEKSRGRDGGGTGLGLAIVRMIARAHNGDVEVESALDKGSCFTVSIPLVNKK